MDASAPHEQSSSAAPPGEEGTPGVIAPPPLVYLAGLALGFVLQALLPATHVGGAVRWPLGAVLIVAGAALARSFFRAFTAARTPVSPYSTPTALVTTGPYRFTRNPAYLGMALVGAGVAVVASSLWVLVGVAAAVAIVDRGVIAREEPFLVRRFGEEYTRYTRGVRRWL